MKCTTAARSRGLTPGTGSEDSESLSRFCASHLDHVSSWVSEATKTPCDSGRGACGARRRGGPLPTPPKTARGPPYWTVASSSDLRSFSWSSGFPGRVSVSAGREADHMSQRLQASRPARAHPEQGPWTHLQCQPPRRSPQASSKMSVDNTRLNE